MNVIVEKNDTFNWFKDIQDDVVYLPIMWLDEGISGPSEVRFTFLKHLINILGKYITFEYSFFRLLGTKSNTCTVYLQW